MKFYGMCAFESRMKSDVNPDLICSKADRNAVKVNVKWDEEEDWKAEFFEIMLWINKKITLSVVPLFLTFNGIYYVSTFS